MGLAWLSFEGVLFGRLFVLGKQILRVILGIV